MAGAAIACMALAAAMLGCDRRDATTAGAASGRAPSGAPPEVVAPPSELADGDAAPAIDVRAVDGSVAPEAPTGVEASGAQAHHFLSLDAADDDWIARIRAAQTTRFKPVGTSSIVFKTTFVGGLEAAFRPRTRTQSRGWSNEVAAYRLSRVLGMDQVPPAVSRSFSRVELGNRLHDDFTDDWPDINENMIGRGEMVWGALVLWVPGLRDLELDTPRGMVAWSRWLAHDAGVLSADEASLAGDLSAMLCFDYLIANVDRWSGSNVRADQTGRRVVIRDHNLAFLSPLPRAQHERVLAHVRRVERFSRGFVVALRSLDEAHLRASLAEDPAVAAGTVLLDDAQIRGVLDRRAALLSRVASLMDAYGESAVLAFP